MRQSGVNTLKASIENSGYHIGSYILVVEDVDHCKKEELAPLINLVGDGVWSIACAGRSDYYAST